MSRPCNDMVMDNKNQAKTDNRKEDIPHGTLAKNADKSDDVQMLAGIGCFEDLMELAGTSGRWNIMIFVLGCYCTFMNPLQLISYEFLGATPNHWCHVHALHHANWTQEQILDLAIPMKNGTQGQEQDGRGQDYEECLMHDYNYTMAVELGYEAAVRNLELLSDDPTAVIACNNRDFNHSQYASTVVTEWDLVCERRALYSTTQAVSQLGTLLGYLVLGVILDYFGRRKVVLASVFLGLISGFAAAFATSYEAYVILKTIVACVIAGFYMGCFMTLMEVCSPSQRSSVGSMFVVPWALGYMSVPGIAYLVREWRWLQAAYTLPMTTLLVYIWILPESPRWLILKERYQDALDVFTHIAKVNRRTLPPASVMLATMEQLRKKEKVPEEIIKTEKSNIRRVADCMISVVALLVDSKIRGRTFITFICWTVGSMVYYGLSLNSTNLSADPYLYVCLGGLVEVPSYLLLWPAIAYFGRKSTLIGLYFLCAVCISAIAVIMFLKIQISIVWLIVLGLSGKIAMTAGFHLCFVYTAELFPTKYRSLALSQASTCSRVGSISSPYINDLLGAVVGWGPAAFFASASIGAGSLALLLPETKGLHLEDENSKEEDGKGGVRRTTYCVNEAFDPS